MCSNEIRDAITSPLNLSFSDRNRIEVESVSQSSEIIVTATIKILPVDNGGSGRMIRHSETSDSRSNSDRVVGLSRELQSAVDDFNKSRTLALADTKSFGLDFIVTNINNMKILPADSDMTLVTTYPEMMEEEQELYRYASLKDNVGQS